MDIELTREGRRKRAVQGEEGRERVSERARQTDKEYYIF